MRAAGVAPPRAAPWARAAILLAGLAALPACGRLEGLPTGRGWTAYRVGAMTVELPGDWVARGDEARLEGTSPDGGARVVAERTGLGFVSEAACLAQAEGALARGASGLNRARRHPTRLGGRPAVTQEADVRGWHGWAWAACDGPRQYRLSFFGVSPLTREAVAARMGVEAAVRFDGAP